jgi:hypothetical protein
VVAVVVVVVEAKIEAEIEAELADLTSDAGGLFLPMGESATALASDLLARLQPPCLTYLPHPPVMRPCPAPNFYRVMVNRGAITPIHLLHTLYWLPLGQVVSQSTYVCLR